MIQGTEFNQTVKYSKKYGGVRKVFEGKPYMLVGGFSFNLEDLPLPGNVLPAGAPVSVDEDKRTITPIYTIAVKGVAGAVVTVAKSEWGVPVKVGMIAPTGETVTAVEDAGDTYKVTFSAAPVAAKEGAILTLYPKSVGKAGVNANALLYCDICLDPYATACLGDAVWFCEYPVLARRTFPITDDIKTQLREAGCAFYFSNRK